MLDLYELEQFVAFAELGTLSRVAEKFHISTPSITRSMQHLLLPTVLVCQKSKSNLRIWL